MICKELSDLLSKIEAITGPLDYDEEDIEEQIGFEDKYTFWLDYYAGTGIEIDSSFSRISLFCSFGYTDFSKSSIQKGLVDPEELEYEIHTWLLEKSFTLHLKAHAIDFPVSTWDDGAYMCPGYTSLVGFNDLPFSEELISCFVQHVETYDHELGNLNDNELRQYIIKRICQDHGVFINPSDCIPLCRSSCLYLKNLINEHDEPVPHYYIGKEKLLFQANGKNFAADVTPVRIFLDVFDACELYDDMGISLCEGVLRLSSRNMTLCITPIEDMRGLYAQIEEMNAIVSSSSFLPFASDKFKQTFVANFPEFSSNLPLIITEGSTDWKHLKKHWSLLMHEFPDMKLAFLEFESPNSNAANSALQEMGSSNLYEMCRAYSRSPLGKTFIFIADRDEHGIISKMGGGNDEYKDWGNNVYSFVLPIPPHRAATPHICIEHYYTDQELKTKYACDDGVYRRLYLGNDFDHYGRNTKEELLCTKRNLCGENSIRVIDGSSDCRVISSSRDDETNYALSKSDFAAFVTPDKTSPSYNAFRSLFKLIHSILFP